MTRYYDLGLGDLVERASRGRISRDDLCHEDPMHLDGRCFFGQCGAAQSHLARSGVGIGDVFLFFGLFAEEVTGERHHRIFGYLKVEALLDTQDESLRALPRPHPHTIGVWNANNTIYGGTGSVARHDPPGLRLTCQGGPLRLWQVPAWLRSAGLTYHGREDRWRGDDVLEIVARGQEFVADLGDDPVALTWTNQVIGLINS